MAGFDASLPEHDNAAGQGSKLADAAVITQEQRREVMCHVKSSGPGG